MKKRKMHLQILSRGKPCKEHDFPVRLLIDPIRQNCEAPGVAGVGLEEMPLITGEHDCLVLRYHQQKDDEGEVLRMFDVLSVSAYAESSPNGLGRRQEMVLPVSGAKSSAFSLLPCRQEAGGTENLVRSSYRKARSQKGLSQCRHFH